jgi:hypothetical protein
VPVKRVKEVQRLNRRGKKPEKLVTEQYAGAAKETDTFHNVVGEDDLTRFDKPKNQGRRKNRNKKRNTGQNRSGGNRNQRSNNQNRNSGNR